MKRLLLMILPLLCVGCQPTANEEGEEASFAYPTTGSIERYSELVDSIIPPDAAIEILASGFSWSEGPLWLPEQEMLIFSDVPTNTAYAWQEGDTIASVYLKPSGATGEMAENGPGSNGLALGPDGKLILCQHGDRRLATTTLPVKAPAAATFETLAEIFEGKRFNSPNDLVFHPVNGDIYFTDPPYGLPGGADSELKELSFHGVFRLSKDGTVTVMDTTLTRPNGIAFSPDGKTAYVANSDPEAALWMTYDVNEAGDFVNPGLFYDATTLVADNPGLPDGLKVSSNGTIFATGPGGVLLFSPEGKSLGLIRTGKSTANCAFGPDERCLYMTAHDQLLRINL